MIGSEANPCHSRVMRALYWQSHKRHSVNAPAVHYLTCLQASGLGEACMLTVQESLHSWCAGLPAHSYFLI